jgi:tetratricopeptide (TPR) repeat protein
LNKASASKFHVSGKAFGCVLAMLAAFQLLAASGTVAEFDQANKLYEEGKFAEAAAAYEKQIEGGAISPTLWFNLGNARYKAGEIGRAVAAYRQAEALSPRDPDVRFNLQFVRKHALGTDAPAAPWLDRALASLSLNEWTLLTAAGVWSLFGLLAIGQWRAEWRRRTGAWATGAGLITILLGLSLVGAVRLRWFEKSAVVITHEAAVRQGPLEESKTAFVARDGAEFKVLDQLHGWWQVRDLSGRVGWVREKEVMPIALR